MRQSITLLILILLAAGAYTAYGLVSFEPEQHAPFVFSEPKLPTDIAAVASVGADSVNDTATTTLTPEQQQQKSEAVSQTAQAISLYQGYEKAAPQQATLTFNIINTAILAGKLPAYFLSGVDDLSAKRQFELLSLDAANNLVIGPKDKKITCTGKAPPIDILVGDESDNTLECDLVDVVAATGDKVLLGGPGNDTITSGNGSKIINPGSGDDVITAGTGRMILVLDDGWGKDTLTVNCAGATIAPAEVPEFSIPWTSPTANFIVLSPRLNAEDVSWDKNVLTNRMTGDTLTVNDKCFTIVSAGN
jgi:hypothetical protein